MHDAFLDALFDPEYPVPGTVSAHAGRQARFNVYRNNVRVSLTEALAAQFPVCRQLVGEDFFNAMAGVYITQTPPSSPLLTEYGASLPEFIEGFAPAAAVPYLAGMARLEWQIQQVQHAADVTPLAPETLQALLADPEHLARHRLRLVPALALLSSPFALVSLWLAHHGQGRLNEVEIHTPETALILRPALSVRVRGLDQADTDFTTALLAGMPLGAALEHTTRHHPGYSPAWLLQCLFAHQAVAGVELNGDTP